MSLWSRIREGCRKVAKAVADDWRAAVKGATIGMSVGGPAGAIAGALAGVVVKEIADELDRETAKAPKKTGAPVPSVAACLSQGRVRAGDLALVARELESLVECSASVEDGTKFRAAIQQQLFFTPLINGYVRGRVRAADKKSAEALDASVQYLKTAIRCGGWPPV